MKLKYKIAIIVLAGILVTIFINRNTANYKMSLVALGDGVSLGMTSYSMVGYSYNDYLMESIESRHKLQDYNNEFSIEHQTIEDLNEAIEENNKGIKTKVPIKQTIAKAEILTINAGMDEFIDYSIKNKVNEDRIVKYLNEYYTLLKNIRTFYDKEIIIIGLYSVYDLDKNTIYGINQEIAKIALEFKAKFLDISALALNREYYSNDASYYMNYKGHKAIFNQLEKLL